MNEDVHSLIGAYALDAVTDRERAEFEQHLAGCEHCRAELVGLRETAASLGSSAATQPPAALRESVLQGISRVRPLPPLAAEPTEPTEPTDELESHRARRRPALDGRRVRQWLIAAVIVVVAVIGGATWHPWTSSTPTTVAAVQQVLDAHDAHRYPARLEGTPATVVVSPSLGKSVLQAQHLPSAPAGHTYQLWYLTAAGKATSAGFITPSTSGPSSALLRGNAQKAAMVAVTIEPTGGSAQPTTKPIMAVKLSV